MVKYMYSQVNLVDLTVITSVALSSNIFRHE